MHPAFGRLLTDATLLAVATGIALGWALYRVANAVGQLVLSIASHPLGGYEDVYYPPLSARIGDRVLVFGPLLEAGVTFAVVLAVVLAVYRLRR